MKQDFLTASYHNEISRAISGGYATEDALEKGIFSYTYYGNYEISHNHDYWELLLVLQGNYSHVLNGKNLPLNKNQCCLIRPIVDIHSFKNAPHGSNQFTIRIKDACMKTICNHVSETFYQELLSRPLIMFSLNDEQINHIINYTTMIQRYSPQDGATPTYFLITYILEKIAGQANFFEESKPKWFADLLLAISSPQNLNWTVNDIVAYSNFSHTHLLRAFKKYEGCSLVEYLTNVKMMHVCNFLLYSKLSILEIALMLGYSDSSHLTRSFKKIYRMSPRQFKQNNQS